MDRFLLDVVIRKDGPRIQNKHNIVNKISKDNSKTKKNQKT